MNEHQAVVNQIVSLWQDNFATEMYPSLCQSTWIEQSKLFNHMHSSNLHVLVFSFADLSILYANRLTAELFGTSPEELMQSGAAFLLSRFDAEKIAVAAKAAELTTPLTHRFSTEEILTSYSCYSNWTIHSLTGEKHKVMFRIFPIQVNDRGLPSIGMYLIYDVKPFMRSDVWWCRIKLNENTCLHYQSQEEKFSKKDILSEREKMILLKVGEGLSSKEIGGLLGISQHTVDNHRRKMLSKTGTLDTSALIYISKLSGII